MDINEQIAVVQAYINHRTGQTVQIGVYSHMDLLKLSQAYNTAINWFTNNNGQINLIR